MKQINPIYAYHLLGIAAANTMLLSKGLPLILTMSPGMGVITRFDKQGNSGYLSKTFSGSQQQHIRQAGLQLQVQIAVSFFPHQKVWK